MKKRILLKITGTVLVDPETRTFSTAILNTIIQQLKQLSPSHQFGIVIGGGNLFRGTEHGNQLGISPSIGHQVGMLATIMNGLIIKDLIEQQGLSATHLCALVCPQIGKPITHQVIEQAIRSGQIIVFTAGTGNPFFTTDTNAVLRALQMQAGEIWKATSVDGIYNADPRKQPNAKLIKSISFEEALTKKLGILDPTAYALAQQHKKRIRIFNIFIKDALIKAAQEPQFGSTIEAKHSP